MNASLNWRISTKRGTSPYPIAARFFLISLVLIFSFLVTYYGGYRSPTIAWISVMPLASYFLLGGGVGFRYGMACTLILVTAAVIGGLDFSFTHIINGWIYWALLCSNVAGGAIVSILYSRYYTNLTAQMVETILIQKQQLAAAMEHEKQEYEHEIGTSQKVIDHTYNQLAKVFYPHQLRLIKQGKDLEESMPIGQSKAAVIAFDIASSSEIKHENTKKFLEDVMNACALNMIANYDDERLVSDAYRIKEMGDGFLCSVGYPFAPPEGKNKSQYAYELSLRFIESFKKAVADLDYHEPIHCGIGIALGLIESYYPRIGTKQYDLHGRGIILATRYESFRKHLLKVTGHVGNVIIIQEEVYASLSSASRAEFTEFDLSQSSYKVRDDGAASKLYYRFV